jgi:hypothetical protein
MAGKKYEYDFEQDFAVLEEILAGELKHMQKFNQGKVSAEDRKNAEDYKNGVVAVVKVINTKLEIYSSSSRLEAKKNALESKGKKSA